MIEVLLVAIVTILHIFFMVLEMFLWTAPFGRKVFGMTEESAQATKVLAMNQGLYNGFLAAGLIWSLVHPEGIIASQIAVFVLGCVVVAGVFGGITVSKKIFVIQALPGLVALLFVLF